MPTKAVADERSLCTKKMSLIGLENSFRYLYFLPRSRFRAYGRVRSRSSWNILDSGRWKTWKQKGDGGVRMAKVFRTLDISSFLLLSVLLLSFFLLSFCISGWRWYLSYNRNSFTLVVTLRRNDMRGQNGCKTTKSRSTTKCMFHCQGWMRWVPNVKICYFKGLCHTWLLLPSR